MLARTNTKKRSPFIIGTDLVEFSVGEYGDVFHEKGEGIIHIRIFVVYYPDGFTSMTNKSPHTVQFAVPRSHLNPGICLFQTISQQTSISKFKLYCENRILQK